GDEAIFLDPYFVMYKHLLTMAGGKSVIVDSYPGFRFPADRVEAAITPRTKLLILNSPSNPTGVVMSEADVRAAVEVARKHDLLILSDEIYEPFLYGSAECSVLGAESSRGSAECSVLGAEPKKDSSTVPIPLSTQHSALSTSSGLPSPARLYDRTIILRGFSKSHAMTGWRLGYAAGPEAIISQMTKLQQYTFVCPPTPFQYAALKALDVLMTDAVAAYRKKRDLIVEHLSRKFELVKPEGAFYIFPKA